MLNFLLSEQSIIHKTYYTFFALSMLYAGSYLPCGKFFTLLEGNKASTFSFFFIFLYLLFFFEIYLLNNFLFNIKNKFLKNLNFYK